LIGIIDGLLLGADVVVVVVDFLGIVVVLGVVVGLTVVTKIFYIKLFQEISQNKL
jgi:hypothetical protein